MEFTLGIFLAIAIIYILWQEKQPKTEKEIKRSEEMKERMRQTKQMRDEKLGQKKDASK
jgi:hypothetical protein